MHAEERHQAILREVRAQGLIRVSEFAEQLGVSPITVRRDVEALAARGLVTRVHGGATLPGAAAETGPGVRERLVFGMTVPSATYYYPEVIRGAREAAAAHGARLILGITDYEPAEDLAQVRRMLDGGVDGLMVTPSGTAAEQTWLNVLQVPTVLVERRADLGLHEHVISDHVHGARLAVRHLAERGHRAISLLITHETPTAPWIRQGFRLGAEDAGLSPADTPEFTEADDHERLAEAVKGKRLTAALVHTDSDAIMISQRLGGHGLRVPDDLAIVAYDDEFAALADTPLTAVAPPKHAVGATAVELLVRRITEPDQPRRRVALLPELRVRSST